MEVMDGMEKFFKITSCISINSAFDNDDNYIHEHVASYISIHSDFNNDDDASVWLVLVN